MTGFVQLWADNAIMWMGNNGNHGLRFGSATDLNAGGWSEKMRITDQGFVGIGTSSPGAQFESKSPNPLAATQGSTAEVARFSTLTGNYSQLKIFFNRYTNQIDQNHVDQGWQSASTRIQAFTDGSAQGYIDFNPQGATWGMAFGTGGADIIRLLNNGNVLIGQTTQVNSGYKLDVNGNARMNKVVVNTTGADYVFDPSYHLRPLSAVGQYIAQYHHLPEVASADSMKKEGLDVGENQITLLKKIEELTLYILQQQQQIETQNKAMDDLRAEMAEMKKKLKN